MAIEDRRYRIETVSAMTGLPTAMLRAWERRYGLVAPDRGASGYREYTDEEVEVFRRAKALVDRGYKIGEVAKLGRAALLERSPDELLPPRRRASTSHQEVTVPKTITQYIVLPFTTLENPNHDNGLFTMPRGRERNGGLISAIMLPPNVGAAWEYPKGLTLVLHTVQPIASTSSPALRLFADDLRDTWKRWDALALEQPILDAAARLRRVISTPNDPAEFAEALKDSAQDWMNVVRTALYPSPGIFHAPLIAGGDEYITCHWEIPDARAIDGYVRTILDPPLMVRFIGAESFVAGRITVNL